MKTLLVDNHPIVRSCVKALLAEVSDSEVLEARTGIEAIEIHLRERPEFIILKLELSDVSSIGLLRRFVRGARDVKILILSMKGYPAYAAHCLKHGAKGYMTMCAAPQEMKTAIREVIGGRRYVEADIAVQLEAQRSSDGDEFAGREMDLLRHLARGQNYREIADAWRVSYKKVLNTANQVQARLNLNSAALVHFAMQLYDGDARGSYHDGGS